MSISVLPVKWASEISLIPTLTIHPHCFFECVYCPIPTFFPPLEVSMPFRISIDLQTTSEILSTT